MSVRQNIISTAPRRPHWDLPPLAPSISFTCNKGSTAWRCLERPLQYLCCASITDSTCRITAAAQTAWTGRQAHGGVYFTQENITADLYQCSCSQMNRCCCCKFDCWVTGVITFAASTPQKNQRLVYLWCQNAPSYRYRHILWQDQNPKLPFQLQDQENPTVINNWHTVPCQELAPLQYEV